jgi:hypothetical protein
MRSTLNTPVVVRGRQVQHDEHEGPDVVNTDGLNVESGDGVGVEPEGVGSLGGHRRWRSTTTEEETLSGGQLSGQGGAHSVLGRESRPTMPRTATARASVAGKRVRRAATSMAVMALVPAVLWSRVPAPR